MRLLDADTLTHLHAGRPEVVRRLRASDDPEVGITIITKAEILRGRCEFLLKAAAGAQMLRAQMWFQASESLLQELVIVPLDDRAVDEFERLQKKKGLGKIGRVDLLVASIALANGATLVTRNLRHFREVPNLELENWVD